MGARSVLKVPRFYTTKPLVKESLPARWHVRSCTCVLVDNVYHPPEMINVDSVESTLSR